MNRRSISEGATVSEANELIGNCEDGVRGPAEDNDEDEAAADEDDEAEEEAADAAELPKKNARDDHGLGASRLGRP